MLSFDFFVLKEGSQEYNTSISPADGCYVYGLYFDGARWNNDTAVKYIIQIILICNNLIFFFFNKVHRWSPPKGFNFKDAICLVTSNWWKKIIWYRHNSKDYFILKRTSKLTNFVLQ